jgi:hypothetical protein
MVNKFPCDDCILGMIYCADCIQKKDLKFFAQTPTPKHQEKNLDSK